MSTTIPYLRCSTSKQEISPDVQFDNCKRYAERKSLPPVESRYVDNGVSGDKPFRKRPAACAMLRDARPGDHIVVAKVDRLGRNLHDLLNTINWLRIKGLNVHIVDCYGITDLDLESAAGKMMFQMMGAIAEFDREMTRQRIREANAYRKERGLPANNISPYGKRVVVDETGNRTYEVNEEEAAQMEQIWTWRKNGADFNTIVRRADSLGRTTPQGRKWNYQRVRRVYNRMRKER